MKSLFRILFLNLKNNKASRSPYKAFSLDVGGVRYARMRFLFSDNLKTFFEVVSNIGSLTISSALPLPPVTPQDTATTPNGCLKQLPTLTIRQLRPLGAGTQLDQRRRRKPITNPLLPLLPNRHPKRDNR